MQGLLDTSVSLKHASYIITLEIIWGLTKLDMEQRETVFTCMCYQVNSDRAI